MLNLTQSVYIEQTHKLTSAQVLTNNEWYRFLYALDGSMNPFLLLVGPENIITTQISKIVQNTSKV